jgi:hypothetical protein
MQNVQWIQFITHFNLHMNIRANLGADIINNLFAYAHDVDQHLSVSSPTPSQASRCETPLFVQLQIF